MEDEKFLEACEIYKEKLYPLAEEFNFAETYKHLLYMVWRIPQFIKDGRKEKANRWLGFVQGALWAKDIYTIEEMKEHNRPNENK
jgi:hypothetical protein